MSDQAYFIVLLLIVLAFGAGFWMGGAAERFNTNAARRQVASLHRAMLSHRKESHAKMMYLETRAENAERKQADAEAWAMVLGASLYDPAED